MTDLRRLAEAATPGPWATRAGGFHLGWGVVSPTVLIARGYVSSPFADAAYIAACTPEVILALLDVVDAARWVRAANLHVNGYPVTFDNLYATLDRLDGTTPELQDCPNPECRVPGRHWYPLAEVQR